MALLYTSKEREDALKALRIKPKDGCVTTKEAAAILTWRAKAEFATEHVYPEAAVRRHVEKGNLKIAGKLGKLVNLYKVEEVFDVALSPNRGLKQQGAPSITTSRLGSRPPPNASFNCLNPVGAHSLRPAIYCQ